MKLGAPIWKIAMFLWPVLASLAHAAGQQSSADYQFTVESIDSGGLLASSGDYTDDCSFGAGSFSTSADYAQRGGYIGQLNNFRSALAGINYTSPNKVNLTTNAPYIFHTNSPYLNNQIVYAVRDGQDGCASVAVFRRPELREIIFRSYPIIYRMNHNGQSLEIVRFWHGARRFPHIPSAV